MKELSERHRIWIASAAVFMWPFLFLSPLLLQVRGRALVIGNDFLGLYYRYKHVLLDVMAFEGRIPFWSPSEGAGYPFFSNPFTASFYPPNVLLAIWYKVAGGYSPWDHRVFTIIGIGLLASGMFLWLRELGHSVSTAVLTTLIFATSVKVVELIRFPNAVHAAAWMIWLLLGTTMALTGGRRLAGALLSGGALVCVGTAGYPYFLYYLFFLLVPWVVLLSIPATRMIIMERATDPLSGKPHFVPWAVALAAAGLALTPYLLEVHQLLKQTTDRAGRSFAYSTEHEWGLVDTLGSLTYPPVASPEGWYYFGIAPLLVMALFVVVSMTRARIEPRNAHFSLLLGAWWLGVTAITFGNRSLLFEALWHTMPGFSSLRVWPRLNIILVPILALVFARAWQWTVHSQRLRRRRFEASIVLGSYAAILVAQVALHLTRSPHSYWWAYFQELPNYYRDQLRPRLLARLPDLVLTFPDLALSSGWFLFSGFLALLALMVVTLASHRRTSVVAILLLAVTVVDVWPLAVRQWVVGPVPRDDIREELRVSEQFEAALSTPRIWVYGTVQTSLTHSVGGVSNWYYERYVAFLDSLDLRHDLPPEKADLEKMADLSRLLGLTSGQRLFLSRRIDAGSPGEFIADVDRTDRECDSSIDVLHYDGDELVVEIESGCSTYLSFIDNWDPDWSATVNGQRSEIRLLMGTFKSVRLEPGRSRVRFCYAPYGAGR